MLEKINFKFIADAIAAKLDASDTKGNDGMVELSIWNKFAATVNDSMSPIHMTTGKDSNPESKGVKGFKLETAAKMIEAFLSAKCEKIRGSESNLDRLRFACLEFFKVPLDSIIDEKNINDLNNVAKDAAKNPNKYYWDNECGGKMHLCSGDEVYLMYHSEFGIDNEENPEQYRHYVLNGKEYKYGTPAYERIDKLADKITESIEKNKKVK